MENKNSFEKSQSSFPKHHKAEFALLMVTNDILTAANDGSVLVLQDPSAAFETVNHSIMLDRVRHWI